MLWITESESKFIINATDSNKLWLAVMREKCGTSVGGPVRPTVASPKGLCALLFVKQNVNASQVYRVCGGLTLKNFVNFPWHFFPRNFQFFLF